MNNLESRLYQRLPRFNDIVLSKIPTKLDACLEKARNEINNLLDQPEQEFDPSLLGKMNDIEET